jgi:hypothetical protein
MTDSRLPLTLSYTQTPRYAPNRPFPTVDPKPLCPRISGGCHRVTFVTFVKNSDIHWVTKAQR